MDAGQELVELVDSVAAGGDVGCHRRPVAAAGRCLRDRAGVVAGRAPAGGAAVGFAGDRLAPLDKIVVPDIGAPVTPEPVDTTVHPPVALAVLGSGTPLEGMAAGGATTVSDRPNAVRAAPPTVAGLRNVPAAARLVVAGGAAQADSGTVVSSGEPAVTRVARSVAASVAQRGGAGRGRVDGFTGALGGGPILAAGASGPPSDTTLCAGELVVLALPNAARDVVADGPRPHLTVTGTPTRLVALRHGGEVLVDETVEEAEVEVPLGAERLAVAPIGSGAVPASAAGWHAGMTLPYIGWGTALGVDATVRVEGSPLARRGDRFRAGWVEAAELVAGTASVVTRFTRSIDVVVVVIDDPVADAGRTLLLGLDGARQAAGADGQPVPPTTVVAGSRAILAYRIDVDSAANGPVSVTVASGTGWHVVGVLGASGPPADVIAALAGRGLDSMVGAAVPPGRGEVTLRWAPATPPTGAAPEPAKQRAVKKQPAKKRAAKKRAPRKRG